MAEYIEREIALSIHEPAKSNRCYQTDNLDDAYGQGWDDALCCLERLPAADVVPVVHGRWEEVDWVEIENGGHEFIRTLDAALRCSNCRNCFKKELLWKRNYCPNCGARMDGGADNG